MQTIELLYLSYFLRGINYYESQPNRPIHVHEYYQLFIPETTGNILQTANGTFSLIPKRQAVLMRKYEPHIFTVDHDIVRRGNTCSGCELKFIIKDSVLVDRLNYIQPIINEPIHGMFDAFVSELKNEAKSGLPYAVEISEVKLLELLYSILRNFSESGTKNIDCLSPTQNPTTVSSDVTLASALKYIDEHKSENMSIDDICRAASTNRTTLNQRFRASMGMSPSNYIMLRRITEAKRLLSTTMLSIDDIAEMTGFNYSHYMSRIFKKHENCSPTEYRTLSKNEFKKYFGIFNEESEIYKTHKIQSL